jgi:hypothetical protein
MEDWTLKLLCAGDGTFIWNCETSDGENQDFHFFLSLISRNRIFQSEGPGICTFIPVCRGEGSVEYDVRGNPVFIAYEMEVRPDFLLRREESAPWMRIEGEGVENAGDVTGTARVSVDVPCPPEMRFLFVDGEVYMV